jgi:hypothetical protein
VTIFIALYGIIMKMDDWGEIKAIQIVDGSDFWCLLDELFGDKTGFVYSRIKLVEAYKNGKLYGLKVCETDEMYARGAMMDKIFCNCMYLLPCLCIKEGNEATLLWIHTRARHMGLLEKLLELLRIDTYRLGA